MLLLQLLHVRRSLVAPVTSSSTLARHRVLDVRMGGREPVLNRHGHRVLWRQGRRHHQDSLSRERRCRGSGRYPRGNVVPVQSVHRPTVHSKLSLGKKSLAKILSESFHRRPRIVTSAKSFFPLSHIKNNFVKFWFKKGFDDSSQFLHNNKTPMN